MAKRRRKEQQKFNLMNFIENNRTNLIKGFWVLTAVLCLLFGYTRGYPLVAAGQVWEGIMQGLAWGVGAFLVIGITFFLNRKLRGM